MRKSGASEGSDDAPRGRRPRRRRAWHRWAALLLAMAVIALLLFVREPASEWLWPDTRVQQLRADAASALQAGDLTRADGRGARELYEAALALDPDRPDARDGLTRVGLAAMARAEAALVQGRLDDARRALQLARELAVPRNRTDALAQRLRERTADSAGLGALLATANAARAAGRLDGAADAALPLYQRVLAVEPNHIAALEGREDTLADVLQRALEAMRSDDLARAATLVGRVRAVDPGHVDLPAAHAALARRATQRLQQADLDLDRGRLPQALEGYRAVAGIDPGNVDAARGLVRIADAHAARSERYAADFRFVQAEAALMEARSIAPRSRAVLAAEQHLARARQSRARLESDVPPSQRKRRLGQLLDAAAAAAARGDLLTPPGESAYDKLRAARSIAPRDPAVVAMAGRLLPAARECFEQALRGNRLGSAGACLDAWSLLESADPALRDARRRLALRWIAVGDERLGAGELQAARHALDTAIALDPMIPGIDEFDARVRRARAMVE